MSPQRWRARGRSVAGGLGLACWLTGCIAVPASQSATPPPTPMSTPTTVPAPAARAGELPEQLVAEVISVRPHDPGAFTQGLLLHDGDLYESTGLTGRSSLRQVEPLTGEVKRRRELAPELFGEGLALAGGRLVQITWQDGRAFSYDLADWAAAPREFRYSGEGWGLCADGSRLVMSDGSSRLTFRDPSTFEPTGGVSVTLAGQPVERLNELECVDGEVYANVWQTDEIVRIDAAGGVVTGVVRADGLLTPAERQATDVLNGIAYDPQTGHFLITGKLWPKLFEVAFVPRATPP